MRRMFPVLTRLALIGMASLALLASGPVAARTVLFVGNSFTFGALSPVMHYHPERVTDLNHEGIGGVPALFATFAAETGQDFAVSLETSPGKDLAYHLNTRRDVIDRAWDVVILQGYSTLDAQHPGDPTRHIEAAGDLSRLFHARNPGVTVDLVATWSRADLTYRPGAPWYGKPITQMGQDLSAATALALRQHPDLHAAAPVGEAWNRAIMEGLADANPYDGIEPGKFDLWAGDHYHASTEGYYLEALVVFAKVTGLDPRRLGRNEQAAADLGMKPAVVAALQKVAAETLGLPR